MGWTTRIAAVAGLVLALGGVLPAQATTLDSTLERFTQALMPASDAVRYQLIFDLQEQGEWAAADREIDGLTDRRLMGHVLMHRYMHPQSGRIGFDALVAWLDAYGDHPGAQRIFDLADRRRPDGAEVPEPQPIRGPRYGDVEDFGIGPCSYDQRRDRDTVNQIGRLVSSDRLTMALNLLRDRADRFGDIDYDRMIGRIAAGYFFFGMPAEALEAARPAADRSGGYAPQAAWIVAMAAWYYGDYTTASRYFEVMATAPCASAWGRSAGAYWAARAHLRDRRPQESTVWLNRAAELSRTFYGLLAARALGIDPEFDFDPPPMTDAQAAAIAAHPAGQRAIGLIQAGQLELADRELVRLAGETDDGTVLDGIVALGQVAALPQAALATAAIRQPGDGQYYDGALYPLGGWTPVDGFEVDPALVHAIAREESRFDPRAQSPAGASGLLQIVPSTAAYVTGESFSGVAQGRLLLPDLNLAIGQRYLDRLMDHPGIEGDILKTIIAYNAGPGNLARWMEAVDHAEDPLFLIEALTLGETRAYVERVMAAFWIYRLRLGQETPSLDALAGGAWPRYVELGPTDLRQVAVR